MRTLLSFGIFGLVSLSLAQGSPVGSWEGTMKMEGMAANFGGGGVKVKLTIKKDGTYDWGGGGGGTMVRSSKGQWTAEKGGIRLMRENAPKDHKGTLLKFEDKGKVLVMESEAKVRTSAQGQGDAKPMKMRIEFVRVKS